MATPKNPTFVKVLLDLILSENIDYSEPLKSIRLPESVRKATRFQYGLFLAGTAIDLTNFASGTPILAIFFNSNVDDSFEIEYRTIGGGGTTQTTALLPKTFVVLPDVDVFDISVSAVSVGVDSGPVETLFMQFLETDA